MAKGTLAAGAVLWLVGCAAMHQQTITNLRNNGEHARADCYERCDPADAPCIQRCDNAHQPGLSAEQQQRITSAVIAGAAAPAAPAGSATGTRTLTINGTTYTGGPALGTPCSLSSPCPDGYSCHLVTDRSGQCVQ